MGFELIPEPDLNRTESNQSINSAARIIHKTMTLNSIGIYLKLNLKPRIVSVVEYLSWKKIRTIGPRPGGVLT